MTQKLKRIVDKTLLDQVRQLPCLACASSDPYGARSSIGEGRKISHPHHVKSRGAGGDDVPENLMPLCPQHHTEVHQIGLARMRRKYAVIEYWLMMPQSLKNSMTIEAGLSQVWVLLIAFVLTALIGKIFGVTL